MKLAATICLNSVQGCLASPKQSKKRWERREGGGQISLNQEVSKASHNNTDILASAGFHICTLDLQFKKMEQLFSVRMSSHMKQCDDEGVWLGSLFYNKVEVFRDGMPMVKMSLLGPGYWKLNEAEVIIDVTNGNGFHQRRNYDSKVTPTCGP